MRQYKRPPVTEGVIDIGYRDGISEADAKKLRRAFEGKYPIALEQKAVEVTLKDSPPASVNVSWGGYRMLGNDSSDICLITKNGVGTSRLAPYQGWEHIQDSARSNFDKTREVLGARRVSRVGVRYINRIDVSHTETRQVEPDLVLRIYPKIPEEITRTVWHFNNRFEFDLPVAGMLAVVQTALIPPAIVNHISVTLDIDIIHTGEHSQRPEEFWDSINEMRLIKNRIFESCITEALREQFDQ